MSSAAGARASLSLRSRHALGSVSKQQACGPALTAAEPSHPHLSPPQLTREHSCPLDVASAARRLLASAAASGEAPWAQEDRSVKPMGVAIPSGAIRVVSPPSIISGVRISSTPYAIDDSGACMTLAETLMWARATPFAPTESGLPLLVVPV